MLTPLTGCDTNSAGNDYAEAEARLADGDYISALEIYQKVLQDYPDSPQAPSALYRTGYIYYRHMDNPKTAMEKYSELFYLYPKAEALVLAASELAQIHSRDGEHLKAIEQYQWLLEEGAEDKKAFYQLKIAKEYIPIYDFRQARIEFNELVSVSPSSPLVKDARFQIATTYYIEGSYEEAIASYDKFLKDYPGDELAMDALLGKASSLEDSGKFKEALALLNDLQKLTPAEDELIKIRIDGIKKRISAPSKKKKKKRRRKKK